jgi:hypothetical protein
MNRAVEVLIYGKHNSPSRLSNPIKTVLARCIKYACDNLPHRESLGVLPWTWLVERGYWELSFRFLNAPLFSARGAMT